MYNLLNFCCNDLPPKTCWGKDNLAHESDGVIGYSASDGILTVYPSAFKLYLQRTMIKIKLSLMFSI